jgi:hypothetical protein
MAGPDTDLVEISLLSGHSARPSISFAPGAPAPTVSVGSGGQWNVTAEGVAPVHVFLAFDGQAVHVASALPQAPVLLAGAPVGTGWTRAPVPCELRFGGACLILRRVPRPGATATATEEATMYDGGALLAAAKQRASMTPSPVTHPLGGAVPNVPSIRPAAGMPPDTARVGPPAMPEAPRPGMPDLGSTVPLADPHGFHEAVLAATAAAARPPSDSDATQVRAAPAGAPAPPPLDWERTVVAPHPPGFAVPAHLPVPYAGPVPEPPPVAPPAPAPPTPNVTTTPPGATTGAGAKALEAWRASSPVKKATLALLPFALVGALFIMQDQPAPSPKGSRPAASASVAAATKDAGATPRGATTVTVGASVDAGTEVAASDPPVIPDVPPKAVPPSPGKRTPEREALDTAAAGAFEDAAKRYDTLAASHPDDPSYKEAARILRAKAGN